METLANKYRPKIISQMIGQDAVKKAIYGKLSENNIPKVSLFYGIKGTGKTTMARIVAKALDCENPTDQGPCCQCASCKAIDADQSTDVIELDAASHNGVADVTAIIAKAQFLPYGKKKVIILDEIHMLSIAAFNKLLKIVEEPPKHVHFIFCTTEKNKVPATILSRCNQFEFKKISDREIFDNLKHVCEEEMISYDEDALKLITKSADGSVRDSLSILEQLSYGKKLTHELVADTLGYAPEEIIFGLLQSVADRNLREAVTCLQNAANGGANMVTFVRDLVNALLDVVNVANGLDLHSYSVTSNYVSYLRKLCAQIDADTALCYISSLTKTLENAKSYGAEMAVTLSVLQLITKEQKHDDLRERIRRLEERLQALEIPPSPEKTVEQTDNILTSVPGTDKVIPFRKGDPDTDISDIPFEDGIDMVPGVNMPDTISSDSDREEGEEKDPSHSFVIPGGEIVGREAVETSCVFEDDLASDNTEADEGTDTFTQGEKEDFFTGFGSFGNFFSPSARQSS